MVNAILAGQAAATLEDLYIDNCAEESLRAVDMLRLVTGCPRLKDLRWVIHVGTSETPDRDAVIADLGTCRAIEQLEERAERPMACRTSRVRQPGRRHDWLPRGGRFVRCKRAFTPAALDDSASGSPKALRSRLRGDLVFACEAPNIKNGPAAAGGDKCRGAGARPRQARRRLEHQSENHKDSPFCLRARRRRRRRPRARRGSIRRTREGGTVSVSCVRSAAAATARSEPPCCGCFQERRLEGGALRRAWARSLQRPGPRAPSAGRGGARRPRARRRRTGANRCGVKARSRRARRRPP